MKESKKLNNVKTISKKVQESVNGGHCPPCLPGECISVDFLTGNHSCVPC